MSKAVLIKDIGRKQDEVLSPVKLQELVPLPPPYDKLEDQPQWKEISPAVLENVVCNLDGVIASSIPTPKDETEEKEYVDKFLACGTPSGYLLHYTGSQCHKSLLGQCHFDIIKPLERSLLPPFIFELEPSLPFVRVVKQHIFESPECNPCDW